jgi:adenylate cyclase
MAAAKGESPNVNVDTEDAEHDTLICSEDAALEAGVSRPVVTRWSERQAACHQRYSDPRRGGREACLRMAVDMQRRLEQLNRLWHDRGLEQPFRTRMRINTGYCNVGNFGSEDPHGLYHHRSRSVTWRLVCSRLPSRARRHLSQLRDVPLVRGLVRARPLAPIAMKGISREVVPYEVEGLLGELAQRPQVISEHSTGLDLFLDVEAIDENGVEQAKKRLSEALSALTARSKPATS